MKTLRLLIFGLCLMTFSLRAQNARILASGYIDPSPEGTNQTYYSPNFSQSPLAIAEAITPDIQNLAQGLQNDPTRIFNYVHDHIRHVFYFGSTKGAELTLLEQSGNDFDQCALLVSLLQAAGYTNTSYTFGWSEIPYDASNHMDLHHWLALGMTNTPGSWTGIVHYFGYLLGSRGFCQFHDMGNSNVLALEHVWVNLTIGSTNYYLDPAFKISEPIAGINLSNAMQLNTNTFMANAGGYDYGWYVQGLNESLIRSNLTQYDANLLQYLSNNSPNLSVQQVIGGQQITSSVGTPLSTTPPFTNYSPNNTWPVLTWSYIPTTFMSAMSIGILGTTTNIYLPQLQGQRLSFTFDSNGVANIWMEDSNVFSMATTGTSNYIPVTIGCTHPYGTNWSVSGQDQIDDGIFDATRTNYFQRTNATYDLVYEFNSGFSWLQKRQQKLDAYRAQGYANSSRQVISETLNVMTLSWMIQTGMAGNLIDQQGGELPCSIHRFGYMGQANGNGYFIDVFEEEDGVFSATGAGTTDFQNRNNAFDIEGYFESALEHGIIEQLESSNLPAASTVKVLEIASTNNQPIYLAYDGVWDDSTYNIRSRLTNYPASVITTLNAAINNGDAILLPQNGSNALTSLTGGWAGYGYMDWNLSGNSSVISGVIGGSYNGGYGPTKSGTADTGTVSEDASAQFDYTDSANATSPLTGITTGEPVRNADAVFEMDTTDLSLGQPEPRGLNFGRHYESSLRYYNNAGIANGWVHNYYFNAVSASSPQLGLNGYTPQQMAPMIIATCAALNIYTDAQADPKNWMVTALISKWAIDQLTRNSISITLGKDTVQFVKQPNGAYTPPANCNMTLSNSSAGYVLSQRHGNNFNFATNGTLSTIVDQYGQTLSLAYSNNLVSKATDWKNRTLTFNYSGGHLSSVTDSSGRTVSYGYTTNATGQVDLTSYIDPQTNSSSFIYDTNHQIIATKDALSQIVVSNVYDNYGRVTTQYTDGDTNKIWQYFWSGFNTLVVDPLGGQQEFIFDDKSRQTGMKDAVGDYSQTFYDGQDHVVMTISPLNETNQMVYDANNNLIESVDPLGYSNQFIFDANYNMRTNVDARGNPSYFAYNSKYQLTVVTNAAGNAATNSYDQTYGLMTSHSDGGGTTGYGYDMYGQLSAVTNAGNLGTNYYLRNALGDLITNINTRGFNTIFQYNNRRQLTKTIAPTNMTCTVIYDAVGNVITNIDSLGNPTISSWSPTRHLISTTSPTTSQGTPTLTNLYDARDWLFKTIDPLKSPTIYSNDVAQRLISTVDPLLRTNTFAYDANSRCTNTTDALMESTFHKYDAKGALLKVLDAATNIVLKAYDANGNQTKLTNKNNNVWQFQYDAANRLTNTTSPLSNNTSQVWNNRGLLQSVTDAKSQTTSLSYDARGRLTNRTDNVAATAYQYDYEGNRTTVIESSKTNTWTYDAYNRTTSYTDISSNVIQYGYDTNGNLTSLVYPGGKGVTYAYDTLNRLTNITDWSSRQTKLTYDLNGRLISVTRPNLTIRSNFYDADGELTNIVEQAASHAPIAFFKMNYNAAGRVAWEFAAPLPSSNSVPTRTISYNADDQMTNFNGLQIVNDLDGNMTSGPLLSNNLSNYTYDARNRLTSAGGISYGYDAINNRVVLTNTSGVTKFVIDPKTSQILMRINPNGVTNYYVYGPGLVYEEDDTSNSTAMVTYHYDMRGSTIALTDVNGNVTDQMQYSAYGTTLSRTGTNSTPFLYNGRYGVQTDANGLLYMRARYYNPFLCRFINSDPTRWKGGLNFYAYANGNPISLNDPFGLGVGTSILGGLRIIGGVVEVSAGVALGAATSWTGIGAVAGGFVAIHGADQVQAGIQQVFSGNQVSSLTSQGLQAAGMSPTAANLTDAGISIIGTAGASYASAAPATGALVHLTDSAGGAGINSSGTLIGSSGIYATPIATASETGAGVTAATGLLPSSYEVAVPISEAAEGAFSSVTPIGPLTGYQAYFGQAYTAAGTLDLTTGVFTQTGLNYGQLIFYGIDATIANSGSIATTISGSTAPK